MGRHSLTQINENETVIATEADWFSFRVTVTVHNNQNGTSELVNLIANMCRTSEMQ